MTAKPTSRGRASRPAIFPRLASLAGPALALACLLPSAALAAPKGAKSGAAPAASDPVVGQVLQLLRDGVTEPVIVLWLQKSGQRPATVTSGDLVALHQAGASEDLMKLLLTPAAPAGGAAPAGSSAPAASPAAAPAGGSAPTAPPRAGPGPPAAAPGPPAAAPGPAAAAPPAAGPAPPAAAAPGPPAAAAPAVAPGPGPGVAAPAPDATGGAVKVHFAVSYRPLFVDDDPTAVPWQLCLYVDGRFVASIQPERAPLPLPARTFERELAPGQHLLRVTQERHPRPSRIRGYLNPARVDPNDFPFEVQRGAATSVSIRLGERSFRHHGPVEVRLARDGKEVTRLEPATADPETWPALCEDIPAAVLPGAKMPAQARRDLASCVHWAALWPGVAAAPSRDEVRAEIARQGGPQ
jgi:hypothetical protein